MLRVKMIVKPKREFASERHYTWFVDCTRDEAVKQIVDRFRNVIIEHEEKYNEAKFWGETKYNSIYIYIEHEKVTPINETFDLMCLMMN